MKLLIVEDDIVLSKHIAKSLQQNGYGTFECSTGEEGLFYIENNSCDLVVLDRMLPDIDGISILKKMREQGIRVPVLMLTAMNAIGDKVDGLDAGADDYLAKPFDIRELLARVRALTRRPGAIEDNTEMQFEDLSYIPSTLVLKGPSGETRLTKKLAAILELFLRENGRALNRTTIFNRIWGPDSDVNEGNLDSFIFLLRRRLKLVGSCVKISNDRGVGYSLNAEPTES